MLLTGLGMSTAKLTHRNVGRPQVPAGYRLGTSVPRHVGLSLGLPNMAACLPQNEGYERDEREREKTKKKERERYTDRDRDKQRQTEKAKWKSVFL